MPQSIPTITPRNNADARRKVIGRRVSGGSENFKATRAFAPKGLVLVRGLCARENCVQCAEPMWMVL